MKLELLEKEGADKRMFAVMLDEKEMSEVMIHMLAGLQSSGIHKMQCGLQFISLLMADGAEIDSHLKDAETKTFSTSSKLVADTLRIMRSIEGFEEGRKRLMTLMPGMEVVVMTPDKGVALLKKIEPELSDEEAFDKWEAMEPGERAKLFMQHHKD